MKKILTLLAASFAAFTPLQNASAHLSYSGRDFGTLVIDAAPSLNNSQTLSSSFGWADATDSSWGDSHRGRFFRFTLASTASVIISVQRNGNGTQTLYGGTSGSLLPAVSLYSGLGTLAPEALGHDSSALSIASRPEDKEGNLQTLADWSLGNDDTYNAAGDPTSGVLYAARLAYFTYIGNVADGTSGNYGNASGTNGDGTADGSVTGTFSNLSAGNYTFFVGGANYAAQLTETGPTYPTYGVNVSVQAVPEPATWALIALGFGFLSWRILHRRTV